PVGESKLILQAKIPTDNPDRDGRPRKAPVDSDLAVATRSGYKGRLDPEKISLPVGGVGCRKTTKRETSISRIGPQTVCRQETGTGRRIRLDRQHQIAPLPRPPRLPRQSAHHAPRHTDRRRTHRHALHGESRISRYPANLPKRGRLLSVQERGSEEGRRYRFVADFQTPRGTLKGSTRDPRTR